MRSPRYAPAGLLVQLGRIRVMIDGGPGAAPRGPLEAWLLTDERAELAPAIRRLARPLGLEPAAESVERPGLSIERHPVVHTNHPAYGYRIRAGDATAIWAPEFWEFPSWAEGADVMFAEASSWKRPIHFTGKVGGHMDAHSVCVEARRRGVKRLVLAHIGRSTIRARDAGEIVPFGEFGDDGREYRLRV
jgi:hypothetical protein